MGKVGKGTFLNYGALEVTEGGQSYVLSKMHMHGPDFPSDERLQALFAKEGGAIKVLEREDKKKCVKIEFPSGTDLQRRMRFLTSVAAEMDAPEAQQVAEQSVKDGRRAKGWAGSRFN
jgi:hypothetical protein